MLEHLSASVIVRQEYCEGVGVVMGSGGGG